MGVRIIGAKRATDPHEATAMRLDLHWRRNLRTPRPHISTAPYLPPWESWLGLPLLPGLVQTMNPSYVHPDSYIQTIAFTRLWEKTPAGRMYDSGRVKLS